jgi:hypothetical protein
MRLMALLMWTGGLAGCQSTPSTPHVHDGPVARRDISMSDPGDMLRFDFTDASAFQYTSGGWHRGGLELARAAQYEPPFRSPLGLALLREPVASDFVMSCVAYQTGREYGHRDLCFVFGYQNPSQYYYAHLASSGDANAHHIMIVDGADRRPITTRRSDGVNWGTPVDAHKVVISREGPRIRVYFDDLDEPVLEAEDETFMTGRIGFGSFDDTGVFSNIVIQGDFDEGLD